MKWRKIRSDTVTYIFYLTAYCKANSSYKILNLPTSLPTTYTYMLIVFIS